jgi:cysteine desulfurase
MKRVYLDHAATTPMRSEVVEAVSVHLTTHLANPSSLHTEGRAARLVLDDARAVVARCLCADPREVLFTSGGTEANNTAILGVARARRREGLHVITTAIEHRAALRAFDVLGSEGFTVTTLEVSGEGSIDPQMFARAITPQTTFASIMLANNEIGTLQPLAECAEIARARGIVLHSDAVQAGGQIALDCRRLGVDLLSLSAHKFGGPKGVGVLYVRRGTPLLPWLVGGGQENGLRAGTENLAGIVGCATALRLATDELSRNAERMTSLRGRCEAGILAAVPHAWVIGAATPRLPKIAGIAFANVNAEELLIRLDLEGIAVSAGSACAAGAVEPSHVLAAMGVPASVGVIRFSLGIMTTEDETVFLINRLPEIVRVLRVEVAS